MRAIGGLLLVLGIVGLLLNLIFWLPTGFDFIVVLIISIVCLLVIWGGGSLLQVKTELVTEPAVKQHESVTQQTQWEQQSIACPKCRCRIVPGQQFCGNCGSSLESYCARCGVAITAPSRFCGNCGAQLS